MFEKVIILKDNEKMVVFWETFLASFSVLVYQNKKRQAYMAYRKIPKNQQKSCFLPNFFFFPELKKAQFEDQN